MMNTLGRLAVVAVVLASLSGCGEEAKPQPEPTKQPTDAELIANSRVATNAPASFKTRTSLADCGEVVLQRAEKLPKKAVRCIESASGSGAELVAVLPTIDDGPYVVYYRGGGDFRGLEVFTDGSRSPYGAFWQHESCTSLRSLRTMSSGKDCKLIEQTP